MIAYQGTYNRKYEMCKCGEFEYKIGKTYYNYHEKWFYKNIIDIDPCYFMGKNKTKIFEIETIGNYYIRDNKEIIPNEYKVLREIPKEEWTNCKFDKNDNLTYFKQSNGYWWKKRYNDNNKLVYYEDSKCRWEAFTFNENNRLIYFANSEGDWKRYTYDEKNRKIYFEASNSYWEKYTYDENNKRSIERKPK